ncbi:MAG: hypothetical protein ACKOCC_03255 [Actinomycetota bacterium]
MDMSEAPRSHGGEVIVVARSGPLSGTVTVPGAKNSVLKLMAAALLADGTHLLTNVPVITDVEMMADLLRTLGMSITVRPAAAGETGQRLEIVNTGAITPVAPPGSPISISPNRDSSGPRTFTDALMRSACSNGATGVIAPVFTISRR